MGDFVLVSVRRPRLLSTLAPRRYGGGGERGSGPYKRIARAGRRPEGLRASEGGREGGAFVFK